MAQFIPKQYKKEQVTIRISFDVLEKIDHLANDYNMSRSEFISQCINFALEHMPEENQEE